jgi:hypothetical protein
MIRAQNAPPAVSITSPADGATFVAPTSMTLAATASDSDGTITKVEFYRGTALLGADTSSPYRYNWLNVGAGSYTLTAVATDSGGARTTSAPVNITVNPNTPPTVSVTSPVEGAIFTVPADVSITASAFDSDGTISKVEFMKGTTVLGSDSSAPYSFSWHAQARTR